MILYIIFDPVTGSGAYKISSGGTNGGDLFVASVAVTALGFVGLTSLLARLTGAFAF